MRRALALVRSPGAARRRGGRRRRARKARWSATTMTTINTTMATISMSSRRWPSRRRFARWPARRARGGGPARRSDWALRLAGGWLQRLLALHSLELGIRWPARPGSKKKGARSCSMRSMFSGVNGSIFAEPSLLRVRAPRGVRRAPCRRRPRARPQPGSSLALPRRRSPRARCSACCGQVNGSPLVLILVVIGLDARVDLVSSPSDTGARHRRTIVRRPPVWTRHRRTAGCPRRPLSDP